MHIKLKLTQATYICHINHSTYCSKLPTSVTSITRPTAARSQAQLNHSTYCIKVTNKHIKPHQSIIALDSLLAAAATI